MFTPQQIQEISFEKAMFGGYDMDSVDDVLEPLTEDYITLYKENSVLKSKLRILVEKLEEYRRQEGAMQSAILSAQKAGEQMVAEAEKKSARILRDAESAASTKAQNIDVQLSAEQARLDAARESSRKFLDEMEKKLKNQLERMEELRKIEFPETAAPARQEERVAFDFDKESAEPTTREKADAIIAEIGQHLEENFGEEEVPQQLPPLTAADTGRLPADAAHRAGFYEELPQNKQKKFEDLKFGKNYHFNEK